jgi:rhodanese-related sulfurtransferase
MLINKILKLKKVSILALLLMIIFCQNGMAAESSVSVSPQTITASTGDTFTIDVIVDSAGSEIYGAQYELYFDNTILSATSQTQGSFLTQDDATANEFANNFNNTLGKIVYGEARMGTPTGVTGSGVLASITFETIKSGTSALTLSYIMLVDSNGLSYIMLVDSNGDEVVTTVNSGICVVAEPGEVPATTPEAAYNDIPVEEANDMIESDPEVIILDVSTLDEYDSEHLIGAKWIQVSDASAISELDEYKILNIIVYSKDGIGSRDACSVLVEHGFENVYNMVGGINAWRINFPIFSAPKPVPTKITASSQSPTTDTSPTPNMPDPSSDNEGLPGFGVLFTITGLLVVFILRRKNVRK